ncbi:MAG: hypothetical protein ABIG40_00380 [Parcubacteria group bacterium]
MNPFKNKIFLVIICFIIFLIITASCLLWYVGGYSFNTQNFIFKDYSNQFYSFRYPNNFKIEDEKIYSEHKLNSAGNDIYGVTSVSLFKAPIYMIKVESYPNWDGLSIADFLKEELNNVSWKYNKKIIVNNREAIRHCSNILCLNGETIIIPTKNYYYEIFATWGGSQKREEIRGFVNSFTILEDEIISSQDEAADWQIYKNEEYGFEIKYPLNFYIEDENMGDGRVVFSDLIWKDQLVHKPELSVAVIDTTSLSPQDWLAKKGTERSIFDDSPSLPDCNSGNGGCVYFGIKDVNDILIGVEQINALQFYASAVSGSNDNTLVKDIKNDVLINIGRHSSGLGEISKDIYKQMLSTFRFLNSGLPTEVDQCVTTTVSKIGTRLVDGITGQGVEGSGSAIEYLNGGYQVSYDIIEGIENSVPGDVVNLCLIAVPKECPPGDDRGKLYRAINLRTGESWEALDAQHMCGGA